MSRRLVDIVAAGLGLAVAAPLFALIALAIRVDIGSPVLFRQVRPGYQGRPFTLVKFRTMRDAVDEHGTPLPDAERLTRLGRVLRSTSLDELPELWNVLRGDMSLVGPRPLLMEYLPLYTPDQRRRHDVKPGLTGWAQVNGRNASNWAERLEQDVWYVENRSVGLDARILLMTLRTVLRREGISAAGHATMRRFRGNASGPDDVSGHLSGSRQP
jgi:lipopolysaccharide/colanic/teichoic acid biosynthesis glycosyltransferase